MTDRDDEPVEFDEWVKKYPPPDLQALAERYGGLSRVPVEAWREFDAAKLKWETLRRKRFER
jgi:hypothetical protein